MQPHAYRWYTFVTAVFVTTLIVSNIIAVKLVQLGSLIVPAAVILFPLAYIFGDILTEVYGYARARQTIWIGFCCNLLVVIAIWIGGLLPSAPFWTAGYDSPEHAQQAYQAILGFTPRLLLASFSIWVASRSTAIIRTTQGGCVKPCMSWTTSSASVWWKPATR